MTLANATEQICQEQLNLIMKRIVNEHKKVLIKKNKITEIIKNPLTDNELRYYQFELKSLDDLINGFDKINEKTNELLKKIIFQISSYVYMDLDLETKEMEKEAIRAYRLGDNETLEEIWNKVKNRNFSCYADLEVQKKNIIKLMEKLEQ